MKKIIFSPLIFLSIVFTSHAQEFKKSDNIISTGIGMGTGGKFSETKLINLSLRYDKRILNIGADDAISLGAYTEFQQYSSFKIEKKWTCSTIGLRTAYNYGIGKLNLYCGAMVLYNFRTVKNAVTDSIIHMTAPKAFSFPLYAGGRYMIANRIGFFTEVILRKSVSVGLAAKL